MSARPPPTSSTTGEHGYVTTNPATTQLDESTPLGEEAADATRLGKRDFSGRSPASLGADAAKKVAKLQVTAKALASPMRQPVFEPPPGQAVTLEAIAALLDNKLDSKLAPLTTAVGDLQAEVAQMKLDSATHVGVWRP